MAKMTWAKHWIRPVFVGAEQVEFADVQGDTGAWADETITLPLSAIRGATRQELDAAKWQRRVIQVELSVEALFAARGFKQ